MKITGTLIKNFFHCKRQAYLFYYGLNFYNETVKLGEAMHEEVADEIQIDNIKIDKIKDDFVVEFKKTMSNEEGSKYQLLYYLYILKEKGIFLKGLLEDLTTGKKEIIVLTKENEEKLKNTIKEIEILINNEKAPERKNLKTECKRCSFLDYCWND